MPKTKDGGFLLDDSELELYTGKSQPGRLLFRIVTNFIRIEEARKLLASS